MKVPGGKLLKLTVDIEDGVLKSIALRGDFFAHPEEGFDRAEASLAGIPVSRFRSAFLEALAREGVELYGISVDDAATLVGEVNHDLPAS